MNVTIMDLQENGLTKTKNWFSVAAVVIAPSFCRRLYDG